MVNCFESQQQISPLQDPVLINDWHVVARAEDVREGQPLQVHLLGERLVLWRCEGQILAWRDRCPHRGVPLSAGWIEDDKLVCPYHGMEFNGEGHCVRIPAHPQITSFPHTSHVKTYSTQERYGYVWVTLGRPQNQLPEFVEWEQQGFVNFHCGPYHINATAMRIVENFTDVAHLPFIHSGALGDPRHPEVSDYPVTVDASGLTASNIQFYQPDPEGTGEPKTISYTYKILRPLVAYFVKGDDRSHFSIFLAVTPVEETKSIAWMGVSRNYAADASNEDLRAFQDYLILQDIPMLENHEPKRLPLDLQTEFHFPADKLAIAYRKWLKELGLVFGTHR